MIPKHIIVTNHTRPDAYLENLSLWNPGLEIMFYDNEQCEPFIGKHFDQRTLRAFQDVKPGAYKADIFRYCAMFILGGIYSDVYIPYQRAFASLWDLSKDMLYLVKDAGQGDSVQISTMASPPASRFFLMCLEIAVKNIEQRIYSDSPYSLTGPELAGACLKQYIGEDTFEHGKLYASVFNGEAPASVDYRLIWLRGEARKKLSRSAFIDEDNKFLFPYKLNKHRGNWRQPTHYFNAWHARDIYH